MAPRSVPELLEQVARSSPDSAAYRFKADGAWQELDWSATQDRVRRVARALISLGVQPGQQVGILSQSRLEWVLCDLGIASAGAVTVGIYPSNLGPDCAYIVDHSETEVLFVENAPQLDKILEVRNELPGLRQLVIFDGATDPAHGVLSWSDFLARAERIDESQLDERVRGIEPDQLASLVYTSGTTGLPKGAMITHGNLVFVAESAGECLGLAEGQITLLFLPLAHVFARLIVYVCMQSRSTIAFAESIDKVGANLLEVRPHFIPSVPRIFEKVHAKIIGGVKEVGGAKEKLFRWAMDVGLRCVRAEQERRSVSPWLRLQRALADRLVFNKVRAAFGGRLVFAVSGAAPLNQDIAEFFGACGVLILEGIGMTENTSFSNVNRRGNNKYGTVGPAGPGVEVRLAEDGEILFRGPNVMKGYFKNPEATAETIDEDGWLHSGDIGEIDEDGFLKITDRKKDLIITAGGKNVAPQRIERAIRASRFISQVVVIGDRRKFISALVTLDPENVPRWCQAQGIAHNDFDALADNDAVREMIAKEIEKGNRGLASYESVKKFRILPGDFSIEGGELTPSLKVKRKVVLDKHRALVDEMYGEE